MFIFISNGQDKQKQKELAELSSKIRKEELAKEEEQNEEDQKAAEKRERLRLNDSFYQKLDDGFDVNILIIGDSIGAGAGSSDGKGWANLLKESIEKSYGVKVSLTNVSLGGNSSYAGYVKTMALNNGKTYDLAVICYGENDSENNFDLYYESIIHAVKTKYPKASIIAIQE